MSGQEVPGRGMAPGVPVGKAKVPEAAPSDGMGKQRACLGGNEAKGYSVRTLQATYCG